MGQTGPADRAAWDERSLLQATLASVGDGVITTDARGNVAFLNPVAQQLTGWTQGEAAGQPLDAVFRIVNEDTRQPVENPVTRALREGTVVGLANHTLLIARDGTERAVDDSAAPITDADGRVGGCVLVFRDTTERRRAERAVDDARAYAEAIVATVREPLVVLDGDLRVRTANRSFYKTFRVRPEDTEGRPLYDLGNGQWDSPALRKLLEDVLPRGTQFNDCEVEHVFPSIGWKVMLLNARKLLREGNHSELILLAIEDVTALREAEARRQEAEVRFTEMVKNVRDHSIFLTDPAGVITSWNAAAERIIGFTEAEAVGRPFSLIFTPQDIEAGVPEHELRQAREHGRAEDERWHRRKDGSLFWALGVVTPLHDPDGRLSGYSKILRDMTEWKRADEARRGSEERFARFMGHLPGLAWIKDGRGRYVFANDAAVAAFGIPRPDLYGRTDEEVFPPPTAAQFRENDRKALATGGGVRTVETLEHPGGAVRHSLVSKFPIPGPDGQRPLVGGVAIDITDEMRTRAVLEESEERFRATFDQAAVGIAHVGTDGRWLRVNRKLCDIVGYTHDELLRLTFQDITHPDDVGADLAQLERLVAGEIATYSMEKRYFRKDSQTVWINLTVALARTPAGEPKYLISVVEDITDKKAVEDALRESERQYRTLFENMAEEVHYWRVDRDDRGRIVTWRLVDANPPALKTWGKSLDAIRGRTTDEIFGPGSTDHYRAVVERVMAGGVPHAYEDYFPALDRHFRFTTVPVGDHFITTGADITAVQKAHESLRQSEDRYRAVLESITDAFFAVGRDWTFTYVNRQAELVLGREPGDLLGRSLWDEYPGLAGSEFERAYRRVMAERVTEAVTAYYPDHQRWYEVHVYPAEGGISVYFRDVTARHRAEAELARLHAESDRMRRVYETALSNTPDYNFMFDLGGRFTYANEALLALWGRRADEALGRTPLDLGYPPDLAGRLVRQVRQVADTREPVREDTPFTTAAGTREFEYTLVPVVGAGGAVEAVVGSAHDITDRKALENRLRDQAAELREADRRKDEFLATLAHELRNPLAPLRNGLQVMKLAAGDAGAVEKARGMMDRQLGQMVHLIDDLMDVSRITRGKLQLRRERVDLAGVVRGAVEASRPVIEASAHRLSVALPPEPVFLDADPTRLTQVLSNLLTNAAKYTERGGRIRLTAALRGPVVEVSVADTGIGIAPEHLPRLFEMFSQVSSALERSQGGLGIGLALVKGLVEMHGGTVAAHSDGPGKGSEFVVRLPVASGTARQPQTAAGEQAAARSRRRILVADDNRDAADSLAMVLRLGGHEVHTAHDGRAAVEAAGRVRPDVAILDIGMPGLTGYDAARRIRHEPWGRGVVLVALTGWGQEEDKRRATEAGFDHHLTKPVDPAALERLLGGLSNRD